MAINFLKDYTTMSIGSPTFSGVVSECERCHRPGAFISAILPDGIKVEKWLHVSQRTIFTSGPDIQCVRTTKISRGTPGTWACNDKL